MVQNVPQFQGKFLLIPIWLEVDVHELESNSHWWFLTVSTYFNLQLLQQLAEEWDVHNCLYTQWTVLFNTPANLSTTSFLPLSHLSSDPRFIAGIRPFHSSQLDSTDISEGCTYNAALQQTVNKQHFTAAYCSLNAHLKPPISSSRIYTP